MPFKKIKLSKFFYFLFCFFVSFHTINHNFPVTWHVSDNFLLQLIIIVTKFANMISFTENDYME